MLQSTYIHIHIPAHTTRTSTRATPRLRNVHLDNLGRIYVEDIRSMQRTLK